MRSLDLSEGDSLTKLAGSKGAKVASPSPGPGEARLSHASSRSQNSHRSIGGGSVGGSGTLGAGAASSVAGASSTGAGFGGLGEASLSFSATAEWRKTLALRFNFSEFLAGLGLSEYEDLLRETGFDDHESLLAIEEDDMDAIGMMTGHKRKLIRAVAELNERLQEEGLLAGDSRFAKDARRAGRGAERRDSLPVSPSDGDGDGLDDGSAEEEGGDKKKKSKEKRQGAAAAQAADV